MENHGENISLDDTEVYECCGCVHPRGVNASITLSYLISIVHAYLFFGQFSYLHGLISTYMLINFGVKFLPTILKRVEKIIFYLVPIRLIGSTRLFFKKLSHLHRYSELTLIRDP